MPLSDPAPPTAVETVRVLLFCVLREAVGVDELELPVPHPPTGAALLDDLAHAYPAVAQARSVIRLAVNETYTALDVTLHAGDEVALITPVSGG